MTMSAQGRSTYSHKKIVAVAAIAFVYALAIVGCKDKGAGSTGGTNAPMTSTTNGTADAGGATNAKPTGDTIVVGEYASLTGPEASFGTSSNDAIQMATEEVNKAGGINGKQVKLETDDDSSDSSKAETSVKRLIDEKNVIAVLGEVASSSSIAGGKVCQSKHIPMITPSSTNKAVTEVGDYIFRVCFIDPFQAAVVARFAHDVLKANNVAIYTNKAQTYSVGFSHDFKDAFEKMGGKIVKEQSYGKDDKDFRGALTAIKAANPQAILIPGYYSDAGSIAKQARELGITVPLLGGDGWDSQALFETGGDAVNGCYFSDHMSVDNPNPTVQKFVDAFKAKYGHKPDALAALAYDAANLLYDSMRHAKSLSSQDIRDAIAATKDYQGVTGSITMDANRNASKPAVMIKIEKGQFKFAKEIKDPTQPVTE